MSPGQGFGTFRHPMANYLALGNAFCECKARQ